MTSWPVLFEEPARVITALRTRARRQCRPAGWSVLHIIFDSLDLGFGEDREAVRDQIDRVAGLAAFARVAPLADAPGDADKIADGGVGEPVAHLVKQGDTVPLRIGLPCFAFAAIVVGGNRDVGDFLGGVDPAEPSDDVKFDDVLHCLSPDRVRRYVLTDMTGPRAACAPAKKRRLHSWKP
jgi:hypothetical protein